MIATEVKERPILFSTPMVQAILEGRKTVTRRVIKPQPTGDEVRIFEQHYGLLGGDEGIAMLTAGDQHWEPVDIKCPYGTIPFTNAKGDVFPGDVLWVRETWGELYDTCDHPELLGRPCEKWSLGYVYKADGYEHKNSDGFWRGWKPSIFMPKSACRLKLEILSIGVERLQGITEEDAIREGIYKPIGSQFFQATNGNGPWGENPKQAFKNLWQSINGNPRKYSTDVGVIESPPIDWDANPWVWRIEFKKL